MSGIHPKTNAGWKPAIGPDERSAPDPELDANMARIPEPWRSSFRATLDAIAPGDRIAAFYTLEADARAEVANARFAVGVSRDPFACIRVGDVFRDGAGRRFYEVVEICDSRLLVYEAARYSYQTRSGSLVRGAIPGVFLSPPLVAYMAGEDVIVIAVSAADEVVATRA